MQNTSTFLVAICLWLNPAAESPRGVTAWTQLYSANEIAFCSLETNSSK